MRGWRNRQTRTFEGRVVAYLASSSLVPRTTSSWRKSFPIDSESQIALFTFRIKHLTEHVKENHKDLSTKRSLMALVGKRRKMLAYLKEQDIERYRAIVKKLGLRK